MSFCLAIQSYPGANSVIARHWEHYKKSGADMIVGIGTTEGGCVWPENIRQEMIGADLYIAGRHLPMRLLRTFEYLLETKFNWMCIAEYDVLFLRAIPEFRMGLTAHLAGGKPAGCHCNNFWHSPWLVDRDSAKKIVEVGYSLLESRQFDASPDCFLGQIVEKASIPVHADILKSYSRNTIHPPWDAEAVEAIRNGAVCVHGVKDAATFEKLAKV